MEEILESEFCGTEFSSSSHAGKISWGKIAPSSGHHLNLGFHDSYFCWPLAFLQCTAQNTNQFLLVETFPYRLENIFCRFQPFSRHGNDFFMTSVIRNIFSFLEKYAMKFSNISRVDLRHKMSVFNDSLMHGHFRVFRDSTTCTIFDIPSLACRIVHDYHSSCSEIFRHIWNWRVYPLRSGAWKLSSSDWLIRLSLILPLQNFIKN